MVLFAGALLGFISVAFGAYAGHGLQGSAPDEVLRSVATAVRYNQVHAVVVVAIGLVALLRPAGDRSGAGLALAAWLFVAGTVLFSFSIYLAALTGVGGLTAAAPAGGILLMAAWLSLAWTGLGSVARAAGG